MENDVCFAGLFWLYYSLVKFLPGFQNLYRSMTRCIAALSFKLRIELILNLWSIVLSRCLAEGSSGPGMPWIRHHTMPRLCQSALPPVANYLQSHYFCNVLSAMLLSVPAISLFPVWQPSIVFVLLFTNLAISRNAFWGSFITQLRLYPWQFERDLLNAFYSRSKPRWRTNPLHCVWHEMSLLNNS